MVAKRKPVPQSAEQVDKIVTRTPESIINSFARAKVSITAKLDEVTNELTARVEELTDVTDAIKAAEERLVEVHAVEVQQGKLDELVAKEVAVQQARKRDDEEYGYRVRVARQKDTDEFDAFKAKRLAEVNAGVAARLDTVAVRETAVKAAEQELADLRAKVAGHDKALVDAVSAAQAKTAAAVSQNLKHEHALSSMEASTTNKLLSAEVAQLAKRLGEANLTNARLVEDLAAANTRVQQIAERAIEGASKQQVVVNAGESVDTRKAGGRA